MNRSRDDVLDLCSRFTGWILFASACDPFGMTSNGTEIVAIRPDGTGLQQLTHTDGFVETADRKVTVQFPDPWASPTLPR
jgi:hypothetical protein